MRRLLLAAVLVGALAIVTPASAHVVPTPSYVTAQEVETITLDSPNERKKPMTSFVVTVPRGLEIVHAHGPAAWQVTFTGSTARWTGASLAPNATASFGIVVDAKTQPGTVQLQAEQRYPDGGVVRWPVSLTVLPANTSPSQNLQLAAVVGLIGVLVIAAVAALAWRKRVGSPAS